MADLETIKLLLRSLLISSPHPLTMEELRRDYKNSEGMDCPFVALGYRNWPSFLQSLTDTVQILSNGLCRPVSTKETQHIQNMVAVQKKSKRKPFRTPAPRYNSYSSGSYSNYGSQRSRQSFHPPKPQPPRDFRRLQQRDVDEFFKSAQEEKTKKRMEELKSSSQTEIRASNPENKDCAFKSNAIYRPGGDDDSDSSIDSFCDRFEYVRPSSPPERKIEAPMYESNLSNTVCDNGDNRFEMNCRSEVMSEVDFSDKQLYESACKVSDVLKRNLRSILSSHPDGVWACVLPEKYLEKFGVTLDWVELGYDSICQMVHDLPDVFICKRINSGDWKLFDAQRPIPAAYLEEDKSPKGLSVPDAVARKISTLAKAYPSGVLGMHFAQLYREKYHKSLLSEVSGFQDIESLLVFLQDSYIHIRYVRKECYVYPVMNETELDEPLPSLDQKVIQELGLYPDEALGPDDQYPDVVLPSDLREGCYVELIVAEVYHLQRFWVQLRKTNSSLEKLMVDLNDFYKQHGDKYKMPESTVCPNQCCAALYENEWHRARISSIKGDNAMVFYVDFGTLTEVPKHGLRFMHKDFCSLPKQAVRASLYGIQPPKGRKQFSDEANKAFLELVIGKPLIGMVYSVNLEVPSLQLFLIDTSGSVDKHLNDILVGDKHADFINAESLSDELICATDSLDISKESAVFNKSQPQLAHSQPQVTSPQPLMTSAQPPVKSSQLPATTQQIPTTRASQPASQPTPIQSSVAWNGNRFPYLPPPGFQPYNIYSQTSPQVGMPGLGHYNSGFSPTPGSVVGMGPSIPAFNNIAPNLNSLAAYQVAAMHQQQAMIAFYQSFLQQNAANLINPTQKPSNLASPLMGNPWLGNPLYTHSQQMPHSNLNNTGAPQGFVSPQNAGSTESCLPAADNERSSSLNFRIPEINGGPTGLSAVPSPLSSEKSPEHEDSSYPKPIEKEAPISPKKVKNSKKDVKRSLNALIMDDTSLIPKKTNITITQPLMKMNNENVVNPSKTESDDQVVDCWEELADKSVVEENPCKLSIEYSLSYGSVALDGKQTLVQSSPTPEPPSSSVPFNYWKDICIERKKLRLFNIDKKGFVSTDELVTQFTSFSSSSSILRVIEAKQLPISFCKLLRPQNLPLFSALDRLPDNVVSRLGLVRNKDGVITGTFHLTPLSTVPSVLMVLGITDDNIIHSFQTLRDQFSEDLFWT